ISNNRRRSGSRQRTAESGWGSADTACSPPPPNVTLVGWPWRLRAESDEQVTAHQFLKRQGEGEIFQRGNSGQRCRFSALHSSVPMLQVCDLQTSIIKPASFSLSAGEAIAVRGPSGAGKTLLLRAVADLDPNEGLVTLDGRDRSAIPGPEWRRLV